MNINKEREGSAKYSELFYRVVAAIFFVPILVFITYFGGIYYLLLIELGIGVGAYEFFKILEARGLKPFTTLGVLSALILGWSSYFASHIFTFFTFTALFLLMAITELTRKEVDRAIYHISATLFGAFYVGWFMSHLVLLRQIPVFIYSPEILKNFKKYYFYPNLFVKNYNAGAIYAIIPFVLAWINDACAYFIGRKFGKRKLLPRISPNKSWEGCIGGGVCAIVAMFILRAIFPYYLSIFHCTMISILGAIAAPTGDLVESLFKRDANIKDAGKTIPGHGGILDRFDSVIFVAPIVYYYLKFFVIK